MTQRADDQGQVTSELCSGTKTVLRIETWKSLRWKTGLSSWAEICHHIVREHVIKTDSFKIYLSGGEALQYMLSVWRSCTCMEVMHVCGGHVCGGHACVWRSEDNLQGQFFLFIILHSGDETQVIWLGGRCLSLLRHVSCLQNEDGKLCPHLTSPSCSTMSFTSEASRSPGHSTERNDPKSF